MKAPKITYFLGNSEIVSYAYNYVRIYFFMLHEIIATILPYKMETRVHCVIIIELFLVSLQMSLKKRDKVEQRVLTLVHTVWIKKNMLPSLCQWSCITLLQDRFKFRAHSGPENLKMSKQKNSWNQITPKRFSWNCIFGSFKLFPSSKIDFWPIFR